MSRAHHSGKKRIRGVLPALQERAIELRKEMTQAERVLWEAVRHKQLGVRFRRQHAVGSVILDFYCPSYKLVIEVDGEIHQGRKAEDQVRTEYLESYGYSGSTESTSTRSTNHPVCYCSRRVILQFCYLSAIFRLPDFKRIWRFSCLRLPPPDLGEGWGGGDWNAD